MKKIRTFSWKLVGFLYHHIVNKKACGVLSVDKGNNKIEKHKNCPQIEKGGWDHMRQAGGAKTGNASKKSYVTSAVLTDNSFQFSLYNKAGLVTVLGSDG